MKDEDIFDILDGIASEETIRQHKILLTESADYQALFNEYKHTHTLLIDLGMEKAAVNFTDKLIDRWEVSQEVVAVQKSYKLPFYFLGMMAALVILLIAVIFPMSNSQAMKIDLSMPINFLKNPFITRSMLLVNALLIFYFIDKQVLKPYFQKRFYSK